MDDIDVLCTCGTVPYLDETILNLQYMFFPLPSIVTSIVHQDMYFDKIIF